MEVAMKEGKYIYCIMDSNEPKNFGPIGIGDRGDELYTVGFDDIAAVVSNSPKLKYSVSRDNTVAHEKAIEEVMKEHTVLPVRFSTITDDEKKIKKILEKDYDRLKGLLTEMKDKKELGIKAFFKKDVIYKEIQENYEDIKALKKKLLKLSIEKTYYQRMEIGRMVEAALGKEKEQYKDEILNILNPLVDKTKINDTYGEMTIINAAFLVNKDKEAEFDQAVHQLDEKYTDKIKFKYVGTVPPFNFVNLVLMAEGY